MSTTIFSAGLTVIAMRWTDRLVGLTSTLILARLLTPADFGIVAMASLAVGLIDVLLDLGVSTTLVQKRERTHSEYSTAWTLRLLQAIVAALIIVAATPYAVDYFREPRVVEVMWLMALSVVIGSFENIGIVTFQKEMKFERELQFFVGRRLAGFIAVITFAYGLETYLALPLGAVVGRGTGVVLSYLMHPMRPTLCLSEVGQFWRVSQWMLIRGIGQYFETRLDKIILGRHADPTTLGAYTLADEIAAMPSTEVLAPLGRVLFPHFVNSRDDQTALKETFLLSVGVQATLVLPAATGLALVSHHAVYVLLGESWAIAIPFLQILALTYGITCLQHAAGYLLLSLGHVKTLAMQSWGTALVFLGVSSLAIPAADPRDLALLRVTIVTLFSFWSLYLACQVASNLKWRDIFLALWRPAVATACMAIIVMRVPTLDSPLSSLLIQCSVGIAVYVVALASLWIMLGRPSGPERWVLRNFLQRRPGRDERA